MKTILTIDIKPHLENYLLHEFKTDSEGNIILSRSTDIGKIIHAHILSSNLKTSPQKYSNPVSFVVPRNPQNHYINTFRFLYVSRAGEQKINDFIEAEFNQRIRHIFEIGYSYKCTQKEIIEAILQEYNIRNCALNYETIKKADYRYKRNLRSRIVSIIKSTV